LVRESFIIQIRKNGVTTIANNSGFYIVDLKIKKLLIEKEKWGEGGSKPLLPKFIFFTRNSKKLVGN